MRLFCFIIIVAVQVTGQTIAPIEIVPIDLSPFSKNSDKKLTISDSSILLKDLKASRKMNVVGTTLFFSGITFQLLATPFFSDEKSMGAGFFVLSQGVLMEYIAPCISGAGAEKTWKIISTQNPAFIRHEGWKYYKKGYAFLGLQIGILLAGTLIAVNAENPTVVSFATGTAITSGVIFNIAKHVSFGRSIGTSNRYTRDIYNEIRGK
jgi:hypothetical protein